MRADYSLYRLIEIETSPLNETVSALRAATPGLKEKLPEAIERVYREAATDVYRKRCKATIAIAVTSAIPPAVWLSEILLNKANIMTVSIDTTPALAGIPPSVWGFALVMGMGNLAIIHQVWCQHRYDKAWESSPSDPNGYRDRKVFELTRERLSSMKGALNVLAPK